MEPADSHLAELLGHRVSRRTMFALAGAASAVVVAGCSNEKSNSSTATSAVPATPTTAAESADSIVTSPATQATTEAATTAPVSPLAGTTLPVPLLLSPPLNDGTRTFQLTVQHGQVTLGGRSVDTYGINGPYLAPTLRASRGDTLVFAVENQLSETTTLHWHGMHLPAVMDGGPMQEIAAGEIWRPSFTVNQQAATLWYHPHTLGVTQRQVQRGLIGLFILDDENTAQAELPKTYGVDDFPLILHDNLNGGGMLVNGAAAPTLVTDRANLRFRVLNATNEQILALGFDDDREFQQIASDGGLLVAPAPMTRLALAPGERAEILVDGISSNQALTFQNSARGRNNGGGTLLSVRGASQMHDQPSVPPVLNHIAPIDPSTVAVTRQFVLGREEINGQQMTNMADMMDMATALRVRLGDVEQWDVRNASRDTHVLHIHDVQFQIFSRNGDAPPAGEAGWKDSVRMPPGDTASLLMRFEDYADPETPYMYHCHVLEHEDEGMMGHFVVVSA